MTEKKLYRARLGKVKQEYEGPDPVEAEAKRQAMAEHLRDLAEKIRDQDPDDARILQDVAALVEVEGRWG